MSKAKPSDDNHEKTKPVKNEMTFIQALKAGASIPDRAIEKLALLEKTELKKVSGKLLDFKHIRINETDVDASQFCIWLELEDIKTPDKNDKPIQLVPHIAPLAITKQIAYFEIPGHPIIIHVDSGKKAFVTFAPLQKNHKTKVSGCNLTFIRSAPAQPLSLKEIKKINASKK